MFRGQLLLLECFENNNRTSNLIIFAYNCQNALKKAINIYEQLNNFEYNTERHEKILAQQGLWLKNNRKE